MNVGELYAEIGRLLNDPGNTRWTTDVLLARMNQAQIEIQGRTNAVKQFEVVASVADQKSFALDSDVMDVIRVYKIYNDGTVLPFQGKTREEADYSYPNWRQIGSGDPVFWIFDGTNQLLIPVPPPNSELASFQVHESTLPTTLVDTTDIPFDETVAMYPYHYSIVHWVVAQCWQDDGTADSLAKARFHRSLDEDNPGEYEKQIKRIRAEFDSPEAVGPRILWIPEGGRASRRADRKLWPFL